MGLFARTESKLPASRLVQENPGFYLSISTDLKGAGQHAARITAELCQRWLKGDWSKVDSQFKCQHFTIAVGGGNTVKAHYEALLEQQAHGIDWLERVRFFLLEESTSMPGWESSRDALVKVDIPYLCISHKDDFMVSANRHAEEHRYLLKARLQREGVHKYQDLTTPVRLVLLERTEAELPEDPLNPHLLLMSTSMEGDIISRQVTAAMSNFVNENAARAIADEAIAPLASVARWQASGAHVASRRSRSKSLCAGTTAQPTNK